MRQLFKKKNKYGAKKAIADGVTFHSILERDYYLVLKQQEKLGLIKDLELQPKVYLSKARILYRPDYKYIKDNKTYYSDAKGHKTAVFNLKARLWAAYMDCPLEIVVRKGKGFAVEKIILPKP